MGLGVRTLKTSPPTLEELFMRHYGAMKFDRGVLLGDPDLELEAVR